MPISPLLDSLPSEDYGSAFKEFKTILISEIKDDNNNYLIGFKDEPENIENTL